MATFARTPTFQSPDEIDFAVSEDGRAFTLNFVGSGFQLDSNSWQSPVSTLLFSLVVPLEGDDEKVEIEFISSTSGIAFGEGTGAVILSVNEKAIIENLPVRNDDQSFSSVLRYEAPRPSECRLALLFLAGKNMNNRDSQVVLTAHSIDGEFLPRPPGPKGPRVPS